MPKRFGCLAWEIYLSAGLAICGQNCARNNSKLHVNVLLPILERRLLPPLPFLVVLASLHTEQCRVALHWAIW